MLTSDDAAHPTIHLDLGDLSMVEKVLATFATDDARPVKRDTSIWRPYRRAKPAEVCRTFPNPSQADAALEPPPSARFITLVGHRPVYDLQHFKPVKVAVPISFDLAYNQKKPWTGDKRTNRIAMDPVKWTKDRRRRLESELYTTGYHYRPKNVQELKSMVILILNPCVRQYSLSHLVLCRLQLGWQPHARIQIRACRHKGVQSVS
jgi:hypothetical protein